MKKTLIALSACTALVLTGCGGDGDSDAEELTKAEFIEQADAICEESTERIEAADDAFADPESPTEEEFETAVDDVLIPELRGQLEDIRDLEPPSEDADEVDEMLDSLEEAVDAIEEDWQTALQGDQLQRASQLAEDYGLKVCSE